MLGNSSVAERLWASQEGLDIIEFGYSIYWFRMNLKIGSDRFPEYP
jgi:hypothetical protein